MRNGLDHEAGWTMPDTKWDEALCTAGVRKGSGECRVLAWGWWYGREPGVEIPA